MAVPRPRLLATLSSNETWLEASAWRIRVTVQTASCRGDPFMQEKSPAWEEVRALSFVNSSPAPARSSLCFQQLVSFSLPLDSVAPFWKRSPEAFKITTKDSPAPNREAPSWRHDKPLWPQSSQQWWSPTDSLQIPPSVLDHSIPPSRWLALVQPGWSWEDPCHKCSYHATAIKNIKHPVYRNKYYKVIWSQCVEI